MELGSPCKGIVKKLEDVNDEAFAQKMMGDGVAITPMEGCLYSPVDGVVKMIFPTMHALGIESDEGIEVLLHIGIDTVELAQGFTSLVRVNEHVQCGDPLINFDIAYITKSGYEADVMMIITNTSQYQKISIEHVGEISEKETLLHVS